MTRYATPKLASYAGLSAIGLLTALSQAAVLPIAGIACYLAASSRSIAFARAAAVHPSADGMAANSFGA